jgi:phosphate transport system permease protein
MSVAPPAGSALEAPSIELARIFRRASVWLFVGFAVAFALLMAGSYLLVDIGQGAMPGHLKQSNPVTWSMVASRCAIFAGIIGVGLFIASVLWQSPFILAKAFAVAAFGATFFGLFMLAVFVYQMSVQAYSWFEIVPPRLEERNQELLQRVGSEEQAAKMNLFLQRLVEAQRAAEKEKEERLQKAQSAAEKVEIESSAEKALFLKLGEAALQARKVSFSGLAAQAPRVESAPAPVADADSIVPDFALRELNERIEEPMQKELQAAATEQERTAILADYAELRGAKVRDLIPSLKENVLIFNKDYVKDLSAPALVWRFFAGTPSHLPEDAGIMPALLGSIYLGLITVICAVPLGVGAAIFLEEYKRTHWYFYVLQTNINNLAGIPSIVYGIFGAFVFVELVFKPLASVHSGLEARNALGGGLTLALLTLPVVIVSAQEAIRAVPQSLRHGALALGATHWQVIRHIVLPNALPGILTGTILALSRALGEAAPLVFFGALLYKTNAPSLFSDFTVLPMQIFGWTSYPDKLWLDNAAMASLVLLITVLLLNAVAIYLRNRAVKRTRW